MDKALTKEEDKDLKITEVPPGPAAKLPRLNITRNATASGNRLQPHPLPALGVNPDPTINYLSCLQPKVPAEKVQIVVHRAPPESDEIRKHIRDCFDTETRAKYLHSKNFLGIDDARRRSTGVLLSPLDYEKVKKENIQPLPSIRKSKSHTGVNVISNELSHLDLDDKRQFLRDCLKSVNDRLRRETNAEKRSRLLKRIDNLNREISKVTTMNSQKQ